jgi:phytoene dehydrogenase-like protein
LGGLLAALGLLRLGYEVTLFEALGYPGGRFTNWEYKGYQLSTGALHMIPHGNRGPLAEMLRSYGVEVEIINSAPEGLFRINGRDYLFGEIPGLFSFAEKLKLSTVLAKLTLGGASSKESFKDWLQGQIKNPLALKLADSFCGWALSIKASQIPAKELAAITKNVNSLGGPGIPLGGCKGVIDALVEGIQSLGGRLILGCRVRKIRVEKGRVTHVVADKKYPCDLVISNAGPKATLKLCGGRNFPRGYVEEITRLREAAGIKISVACDKAMLGHSGVLFTPQAARVCGVNEVTNADPGLAPKGKHLLMSHQVLTPGRNVREEIRLGIRDLRSLFPDFKEHCKVLAAQCYRNGWPVNRAVSGQAARPETPVKGLYLVGDAVKPRGYMETEGVAAGVKQALQELEI